MHSSARHAQAGRLGKLLGAAGLAVSVLLVCDVAAWAGLAGSIVKHPTFSSGTMLATATASSSCVSSPATITTNSTACGGTAGPSGQLALGSTSTGSLTLATSGTVAPTGAAMTTGACGVAQAADSSGTANIGLVFGGITYGAAGPLAATALSFDGSTGWVETLNQAVNPQGITEVGWFKTTAGGTVLGFSDAQLNAGSANNDRDLWVDPAGHVVYAVHPGASDEITSPGTYKNGSWHFFAASIGPAGQRLYVDGISVATNAAVTTAQNFTGWWTLGWGAVATWANPPTTAYFNGSLAQTAVLPAQLTAAQVSAMYTAGGAAAYATLVAAKSPTGYWPMTDLGTTAYAGAIPGLAGGTALADVSGNANNGTGKGAVTLGVAGPLGGNALALDGATGWAQTTTKYNNTQNFTELGWFKTTVGGTIMSWTTVQATGAPVNWDRHVWVDPTGHVVYGVYNGATDEITSLGTYNDGNWHMVAAEISGGGQRLYLDGTLAGSFANTAAENSNGWWHLGWGNENNGWPDPPTNPYWNGSLAQLAIIPIPLTAAQVSALYDAGTAATYSARIMALAPVSYWPLTDPATGLCGRVNLTVQVASSAGTACAFPSGAGACPAPAATATLANFAAANISPPTATTADTITIAMRLNIASPAAIAGLHLMAAFAVSSADQPWTAQLTYPSGSVQL